LCFVLVPDELSFEFGEFDVIVVEFSGNFWLPVVLKLAEFLVEVYFFHFLDLFLRIDVPNLSPPAAARVSREISGYISEPIPGSNNEVSQNNPDIDTSAEGR